jgi:hypothetical protein
MKRFALLGALILPAAALAQQQTPSPEMAACQQELLELTSGKYQWRTQANLLQREVEDLKRQLAEVNKATPSPMPPK